MAIKQWLVPVIAIGALGGWGWFSHQEAPPLRFEGPSRFVEGAAGSAAHSGAPPTQGDLPIVARTLTVGGNQVEVLDIPSVLNSRLALVETQRCYVWRDLEFKTSSITCPRDAPADYNGPEPDITQRP